MADNRRSRSQGYYYFSRGQLVILALGFIVTCTVTFFLGMLIGQGIEERKLVKKQGQGPVAKLPARPTPRDSRAARGNATDQELTFYDTLTKPPPRGGGASGTKAPGRPPRSEVQRQAKARVSPPPAKAKQPRKTRTASTSTQANVWSVQVKAFARQNDANDLARRLKRKGYDAYVVSIQIKGRTWYRVRVGRLGTQREAQNLLLKLKREEKYTRAIITRGGS
ncbi:MAG: hypothetical protein GTO40_24685 [Deltaproteobacteria bacterium]|nr:hypothetical protein [Deltaproteobacteria bacterium]